MSFLMILAGLVALFAALQVGLRRQVVSQEGPLTIQLDEPCHREYSDEESARALLEVGKRPGQYTPSVLKKKYERLAGASTGE